MQKTLLALALALPALAGRAQAPDRPAGSTPLAPAPATPAEPPPSAKAKAPLPRGAVLEEVSGTVREVDRKVHRLAVETAAGPVSLSLDRNTMVYTAAGLGTMLDLVPGQQIRAGRNADFLAYWVQVRGPVKAEPPSTPAQGTGPAGSAAAPAGESTGPGAGPAPGAPTGPGASPPGSSPPAGTPPR